MNVMVICAHPDDETLGCGGTMLKHVQRGDSLTWVVATQAHEPQWSSDTIAVKTEEVDRVARKYSARLIRLGLPSSRLDVLPGSDLIAAISDAVDASRPEVIYVVHPGDVHTDHGKVFEATLSVVKAFRMGSLGIRRVLAYETLSSTDAAPAVTGRAFVPTVFIDISSEMTRKLEIMALYASEAQADPLPRGPSAIRALARMRGATVGVEYAEAFWLVRELG